MAFSLGIRYRVISAPSVEPDRGQQFEHVDQAGFGDCIIRAEVVDHGLQAGRDCQDHEALLSPIGGHTNTAVFRQRVGCTDRLHGGSGIGRCKHRWASNNSQPFDGGLRESPLCI